MNSTGAKIPTTMAPKKTRPGRQSLDLEDGADQGKIPVLLPDMFVSFLARKPRINPHHVTVKAESEAWLVRSVYPVTNIGWNDCSRRYRTCGLDERMMHKISRSNFAYFSSMVAPDAGPNELRTMYDWCSWVRENG